MPNGAILLCGSEDYVWYYNLLFDNSLRKFFAWSEAHAIFPRHFDCLSVAWINPFTSSALAHFERAKAYQSYLITLLKCLANRIERCFQYFSSLLLREFRLFGNTL